MFKDTEIVSSKEKIAQELTNLAAAITAGYIINSSMQITKNMDPSTGDVTVTIKYRNFL